MMAGFERSYYHGWVPKDSPQGAIIARSRALRDVKLAGGLPAPRGALVPMSSVRPWMPPKQEVKSDRE
jgi:hypothetical protein